MSHLEHFDKLSKIRDALNEETDRGCVLLACSLLDNELENLLTGFFIDIKKIVGKIFEGQGGLSTFSVKIDIAFILGLISKQVYNDINLIRKIRNEFAHSHHLINLNTENVKNIINNLKTHYRSSNDSARRKFISSIYCIITFLNMKLIKTERMKEMIQDVEMEKKLNETTNNIIKKTEEYYDFLKEVYKGSPNSEKLISEDFHEYLNQLKDAGKEILNTIDKAKAQPDN